MSKIPKLIFQTWKTESVPDKWKESPVTIKKYLSNWSYFLSTDQDNRKMVQTYFPDFLSYYDAFQYPIQRADAMRYCFLYLYGGVYMDLDLTLARSFDYLFNSGSSLYFVASGNLTGYITNSFMASKPRHPLWLDVIEEMKKPAPKWALTKHFKVMTTTGPIMLNRVVKSSNYQYTMLPNKLFMPCSVCNMSTCDTSEAILKPLEGGSWNSFDSKVFNYFMCHWRGISWVIIIIVIILFLIILLLWKRQQYCKI
jgi:mannosyltransferase OCH1-like enzyme